MRLISKIIGNQEKPVSNSGDSSTLYLTREESNLLSAKNFNAYPYSDTTKTLNGVTWTDNGDGIVNATGKASGGYSRFNLHSASEKMYLPNGTYIFSGCPSGGSNQTYSIFLVYTKNNTQVAVKCFGTDAEFTINGSDDTSKGAYLTMGIDVENNVTLPSGGLTFEPMFRLASDPDNTFIPYAMTNRELTERIASNIIAARIDISSYSSTSNMYTAPSDGYFEIINQSGDSGIGCVGGTSGVNIGGLDMNARQAVYVRKGMKMYVDGAVRAAFFIPIE